MKHRTLFIGTLLTIVLLALLAVTPAAAGGNGQGRSGDRVRDSYIVILQADASANVVASQHGVAVGRSFTAVFNGFSAIVPPGRLNALRNDPRVLSVSANRVVTANPKPDNPGNGNSNKPPNVEITNPADGATFASGESILFEGTASDKEDGDLTASLAWESSIDGPIGTGGSFQATLSDGDHTITASVTDSGGKTGSDSVGITVGDGGGTEPSTQVVPSGVKRIGADTVSYTGAGVGVAIVDTGLDFGHADLAAAAACFTAFSSCQDDNGHGTHVGGIVAALDNTIDVVGVAPGATVYAVKVLDGQGSGTDETVIAGLDWVAANWDQVTPNIRVVNMSLGRPASEDDTALQAAVQGVYNLGISLAVSAGNAPDVEVKGHVPSGFPEVMAVASTTALDGKGSRIGRIKADTASFFTTDGAFDSNTNIGVTISGPGEAQEDVRGAIITSVGILSLNLGGGTVRMSGTSMSAPHLAGVLALMWDKADDTAGGTLDPEAARTTIRNSADRKGDVPLDSPTGSYTFDGEREGILSAVGALG